jgi:flotillin
VVLNGADGMADLLTKALAMGGTGLGLARQLLASMGEKQEPTSPRNGSAPVPIRKADEPAP